MIQVPAKSLLVVTLLLTSLHLKLPHPAPADSTGTGADSTATGDSTLQKKFFFIWQAIVRGRPVLRMAFLFLAEWENWDWEWAGCSQDGIKKWAIRPILNEYCSSRFMLPFHIFKLANMHIS